MNHSRCITSAMQYSQISHGATSPLSATYSDRISSGSRSPPVYQHDSSSSYEDSSSSSSMNCRHSCKSSVKSFSSEYNRRTLGDSFQPGMKDVPAWLKALRLHKYTEMFQELSYDEMLNLNETELERRQVTKGARKKILQSIQKLKNRADTIRDQFRSLSNQGQKKGCLRCAIISLRQMLLTPIRPYEPRLKEPIEYIERNTSIHQISDENIPALLLRLLVLVHGLVFPDRNGEELEDEFLLIMFCIYDRVANNEAFLECQRRRAIQLKKQARRYISPHDLRRNNISLTHSSGRCDNCQHRTVSNSNISHNAHNTVNSFNNVSHNNSNSMSQGGSNNHEFHYKATNYYGLNQDRRERSDNARQSQQRVYNAHTYSPRQQTQAIHSWNNVNSHGNQHLPVQNHYTKNIWKPLTCAQEARLMYDNGLKPSVPSSLTSFAQLPQYQKIPEVNRPNQHMMAAKSNYGNRMMTDAHRRQNIPHDDLLLGSLHGMGYKEDDEAGWFSFYSNDNKRLYNNKNESFIWSFQSHDSSDSVSNYSSSASNSGRSSDAGSPRIRPFNNRVEENGLSTLVESLNVFRLDVPSSLFTPFWPPQS